MYPTRIGFQSALNRISALTRNQHHAEALVTSVFTMEKLMRRSLRVALIARGFTSKQADKLLNINGRGFKQLKDIWVIFDKSHQTLPDIVGARDWQNIPKAVEMRNKLVHGHRVYSLEDCKQYAACVIVALNVTAHPLFALSAMRMCNRGIDNAARG